MVGLEVVSDGKDQSWYGLEVVFADDLTSEADLEEDEPNDLERESMEFPEERE